MEFHADKPRREVSRVRMRTGEGLVDRRDVARVTAIRLDELPVVGLGAQVETIPDFPEMY